MHFTLVSTIYNEAQRLHQTISDIEAQTLPPTEIIITDAGSTDGSLEILNNWKEKSKLNITVIVEKGCNVARGRNIAIEAATTGWIVSTDFGCRFDQEWLESLLSPVINNNKSNSIEVIGGAYTVLEKELTTKAEKGNYILTNGYKIELNESFIPSSRSIAYKKDIWEKAGKYPEWLTLAADDLVFGLKLKALGVHITLVDKPLVYWGRHTNRKQYNKEAYRYGLGDGEAGVNYRNFWSNLIETGLRYLFFISVIVWIIFLFFNKNIFPGLSNTIFNKVFIASLSLITLISFAGFRSYYYTFKNWKRLRSRKYNFPVFVYALFMLEQQRFNYIKGYIQGHWFSSKNTKERALELQNYLNQH